jgi:hypothetical protein
MQQTYVQRATIEEFLARLRSVFTRPARLYLVAETTQVFEGWRERTARLEFAAEIAPEDRAVFDRAIAALRREMGIEVFEESPRDVIPLPAGYESRTRVAIDRNGSHLEVYHFDPYSVAFRAIARGDEPDYQIVLAFLRHGWMNMAEMLAMMDDLLPQFTSETIQQDPAEFRRKFRGLQQMWRAAQAGAH